MSHRDSPHPPLSIPGGNPLEHGEESGTNYMEEGVGRSFVFFFFLPPFYLFLGIPGFSFFFFLSEVCSGIIMPMYIKHVAMIGDEGD
jgi:hypothetical protein